MGDTFFYLLIGGAILILLYGGLQIYFRYPRIKPPEEPDPYLQAVAEHCWKTGKTVTGSVDEEGRLTITEHEQHPR